MLNTLRGAAAGLIAKIFIGLLVASFAVWGINDIFRGYGGQSVAEVGNTEVSTAAFQSAYQRELSAMADRLGRQLTPDEARALGVDRRVLGQLLTSATLANQARELNLRVSDKYIAEQIVSDAVFFDAFGRFDRSRFEYMLSRTGYSEAAYAAERERQILRDQLTETVTGDIVAPQSLLDAVREFQGARRVVEYFTVPAIDPASLGEPTNEALTTLYNEHKEQFTSPEFRALAVLSLEPADLAPEIDVSEEDIARDYDARRGEFETTERRSVDQILFADADKAAAAQARIADGADFLEVAAENGFSASDIDLGTVTQAEIVDPAVAKAAFELAAGEISEPITGTLGTAIVRVRDIDPAVVRPLEEVRGEIRDRIALERAGREVHDLRGLVEDERAAGSDFPTIADKLNLRAMTFAAVDRRGRGPDGEPVPDLPANPDLLRVAFDSDVGIENESVDSRTGGFLWVDVTDVTAPEAKPFEQVRDEVMALWREQETAKKLREKADELIARGREGETIAGLADRAGAELRTSEPFVRRAPTTPFAPSFVEAIFAAPEGGFLRGPARDDSAIVVAQVAELLPAEPLSPADQREIEQQMAAAFGADIFEEYVSGLQALDGVSVNTQALNALFGDGG